MTSIIAPRTHWTYLACLGNLVRTMIKLESIKDTLDVVDDQRGQPIWTVALADRLVRLGRARRAGGYRPCRDPPRHQRRRDHLVRPHPGDLPTARRGPRAVRPTTSAAYVRPAPRPAYSVLGHNRWAAVGVEPIRDWREALHEAFPALLATERP
ncbi:sugar nucleotide-binding protein [Streptomyces canus]|uniref:sugar nucleotide-binding protein n=1 Tax=Streptomyces canus TaxID=58343 RepID=UPI0036C0385F